MHLRRFQPVPTKQLDHFGEQVVNRSVPCPDIEPLANALKSRVMEGEYKMLQLPISFIFLDGAWGAPSSCAQACESTTNL